MGYEDRYDPDADFDRWYTIGTGRAIGAWIRPGDDVLELGCATGAMSAMFSERGARVVGLDRATRWLARATARALPDAAFVEADLDTFELERTFQHVVAANVAHEVSDPEDFLRRGAAHLAPGGLFHISLPNPRSLHRLLGVAMGLVADVGEISDRARELETLRVLDVDAVAGIGRSLGLDLLHTEPVMLKPLPNELMAELPDEVIEGFLAVAPFLPEHGAMNYMILGRR